MPQFVCDPHSQNTVREHKICPVEALRTLSPTQNPIISNRADYKWAHDKDIKEKTSYRKKTSQVIIMTFPFFPLVIFSLA